MDITSAAPLALSRSQARPPPRSRPFPRTHPFLACVLRSPAKGFEKLGAARAWAASFGHWYNVDHHHSSIRYVSPAERHDGRDVAVLAARHALYLNARERNPARWSGNTRDWSHIGVVTLNPERDSVVAAHLRSIDNQPLSA